MQIEIKIDGLSFVNMQLNEAVLAKLLGGARAVEGVPRSTPITVVQTQDLLSRIDAKSVQFLKQIAVNGGEISWGEMRRIFGISDAAAGGWTEFSSSYGKGITRALRNLTGDKSARLVCWNDDDWPDGGRAGAWDDCKVFIDGLALKSLREATGIA
ncbi:hypothetical protein SAMN05216573_102605 [Bradyrhizobium sp. Rc3b]|nr:hypothetical protein SAMN05216573_102605 [Bradyrhizobium sp. Rc3b]